MTRRRKRIVSDFYTLRFHGMDVADVILHPPEGGAYIVRGVRTDAEHPGELETSVRLRYYDWLAAAEKRKHRKER